VIVELKKYPELLRIIRAAAPRYSKHKAIVDVYPRITLSGTYWDGGSRSSYVAVNLTTMQTGAAPQYNPPQFGGPRTDPVCDIPEGVAIVRLGTFCGKTATAGITLHPNNVAKLLPQT
jgi:hypothetical protein